MAAPRKLKVKKPAGLKTRPAWLQQGRRRSAAATRAARRGVRYHASLEADDGDHPVPRPDSDGEGGGAATQDRVGAVLERLKGWNHAAPTDPDEWGGEQLGWQLAGQVGTRIVPRQRRSRDMQVLDKILTIVSTVSSSFCKN